MKVVNGSASKGGKKSAGGSREGAKRRAVKCNAGDVCGIGRKDIGRVLEDELRVFGRYDHFDRGIGDRMCAWGLVVLLF